MNATETDVKNLLDEAFDECECVFEGYEDHEGGKAGYYVAHGCVSGFVCRGHLKFTIDVLIPSFRDCIDADGALICRRCERHFHVVDDFAKVYPL